jgi:uridine kinase
MPIIIAIGGGSGSGKTTLADAICQELGDEAARLSFDSYYKDQADLSMDERRRLNYDSPAAFDMDLLMSDLEKIKKGETINIPVYDFSLFTRGQGSIPFAPKKYVIVDGILALEIPRADELYDYKVFVKADSDIRLARRILRDTKERGRSPESVISQYLATVRPMHLQYVEPARYRADFVFDNSSEEGLDPDEVAVLKAKILRLGAKL